MASFADALPFILGNEGGLSDDAVDKGGLTNFGVTQAVLADFKTCHPELSLPYSVEDLTEDEAAVIYHTDYWRFDEFASQRVATKVFDLAVNMGLRRAVKILQEALPDNSIVYDGQIGPKTIQATNAADEAALLSKLCDLASERYWQIVHNDPAQTRFLKGWLARANRVPQ